MAVKHLINVWIFIAKMSGNFNLTGQQPKSAFSFGFMDNQIDKGQVVLGNNNFLTVVGHINQFGEIGFCFRNINDHMSLL